MKPEPGYMQLRVNYRIIVYEWFCNAVVHLLSFTGACSTCLVLTAFLL